MKMPKNKKNFPKNCQKWISHEQFKKIIQIFFSIPKFATSRLKNEIFSKFCQNEFPMLI